MILLMGIKADKHIAHVRITSAKNTGRFKKSVLKYLVRRKRFTQGIYRICRQPQVIVTSICIGYI